LAAFSPVCVLSRGAADRRKRWIPFLLQRPGCPEASSVIRQHHLERSGGSPRWV